VDQASRRRLHEDLTRLADGDREAFHPVFALLLPLLRRFASRSLPSHEAEDAAQEALVKIYSRAHEFDSSRDGLSWALGITAYEIQEALVKIYSRAHEFDSSRDGLSWALGITAYEIKTARRRRERRREADAPADEIEARADSRQTPEAQAVARDLDAAIDAALAQLSPSDAATLRAYAAGERPPDVAGATFRKRVERSLARLRALWRASHGER